MKYWQISGPVAEVLIETVDGFTSKIYFLNMHVHFLKLDTGYSTIFTLITASVSDPEPVGSAFNLGLDPGSGSVFGIRFRIQMSKKRFKKPKFTLTDFKDKNRKMLRLSWNLTTVSSHFFKNLLLLAILSFIFYLYSHLKNKKYFFYKFDKAWIRDPDPYWDFRLDPYPD